MGLSGDTGLPPAPYPQVSPRWRDSGGRTLCASSWLCPVPQPRRAEQMNQLPSALTSSVPTSITKVMALSFSWPGGERLRRSQKCPESCRAALASSSAKWSHQHQCSTMAGMCGHIPGGTFAQWPLACMSPLTGLLSTLSPLCHHTCPVVSYMMKPGAGWYWGAGWAGCGGDSGRMTQTVSVCVSALGQAAAQGDSRPPWAVGAVLGSCIWGFLLCQGWVTAVPSS